MGNHVKDSFRGEPRATTRSARTAILILAMSLAACSGTPTGSATSTRSAPTSSAVASGPSTTIEPSPSAATSECTSVRGGGSGTAGTGSLVGQVKAGRILFTIEAGANAPSGTFAIAVIDQAGFHSIPTDDWTIGHAIWAPNGGIVFDSERNGDRHLFHASVDGTGATQLTTGFRVAEQSGALSETGKLTYDHYGCAKGDTRELGIQVANADGSSPTALTPDHPVDYPTGDFQSTISPDGKTVVFARASEADQPTGGLFSVPIGGGEATRLTPDAPGIGYPHWRPDGRAIIFTQNDADGGASLWLFTFADGSTRQVTKLPSGTLAFNADWSPDGSELVFEYYEAGWDHNALHVIKADGTGDTALWTGDHSTAEIPDWGR